jgi:predicted solute-binding protein
VSQPRFGATDFASVRPLLFGLLQDESLRGSVSFEPASQIVDAFGRGKYDAALIPTIEYLRGNGQYLLAGPALVGRSAPGGVMLVSQKPIDQVERIAVSEHCRNGVAVLRIVLGEGHSVFPDMLVEKRIGEDDWRERYDAVLLTGNAALRESQADRARGIIRYNVSEMWKSTTHTPLVHAVWVYNDRRLANEISLLLTASRDEGTGRLAAVCDELAKGSEFESMFLYDHLSRAWRYELGEPELDGLRTLNDLARKYDLIRENRLPTAAPVR